MKKNDDLKFGKKELIELLIPTSIFILISIVLTCVAAIFDACL